MLFLDTHNIVLKNKRKLEQISITRKPAASDAIDLTSEPPSKLNFLTFNVWFMEHIEIEKRMREITDIIIQNDVHFVAFQECTPLILQILNSNLPTYQFISQSKRDVTGSDYFTAIAFPKSSPTASITHINSNYEPFENSKMGRGLQFIEFKVAFQTKPIIVATSHLESPLQNDKGIEKRTKQLIKSTNLLSKYKDSGGFVIFMGDLNWITYKKKEMDVPQEWTDLWKYTTKDKGFTYDQKLNLMMPGNRYRNRLDRVLVHTLPKEAEMELVGTEQIKDYTYTYEDPRTKQKNQLPLFPSDHFGILTKITL